MTQRDGRCIKIFKQARAGIWKPEEIELLEKLLARKTIAPRDDPQNIFFQDIAFTNENLARIKCLLVANRFVHEIFQVCEGRLADISLQEEEKISRTIIVEKDSSHEFGFTAHFVNAPDHIGRGRSEAEAIGSLIISYRIPSQSPSYTGCIPAETSLGINIIWGRDSATFDYLADIKGHGAFHDSDGDPLIP